MRARILDLAIQYSLRSRDDVTAGSRARHCRTPLSLSAGKGMEAVVRLLAGRSEVEPINYRGRTPLFRAAERSYMVVVQLLAEKGDVLVNPKGKD